MDSLNHSRGPVGFPVVWLEERTADRTLPVSELVASHRIADTIVYVMAPMAAYRRTFYDRALRWARDCFPNAAVVSARDCWRSNDHWRHEWMVLRSRVGLGVIVTDRGGIIGRGVQQELDDLRARDIPVVWLTGTSPAPDLDDDAVEFRAVMHFDVERLGDDWQRWSRLILADTARDRTAGGPASSDQPSRPAGARRSRRAR